MAKQGFYHQLFLLSQVLCTTIVLFILEEMLQISFLLILLKNTAGTATEYATTDADYLTMLTEYDNYLYDEATE